MNLKKCLEKLSDNNLRFSYFSHILFQVVCDLHLYYSLLINLEMFGVYVLVCLHQFSIFVYTNLNLRKLFEITRAKVSCVYTLMK